MYSHTVLTAADVRLIARHARAAGLNQQVTATAVKRLDPDGFSIMSIVIPFHHGGYGLAHHRVRAWLKMTGTREPAEVLMDVLKDDWDKLPEARAEGGMKAE